MKKTVQVNQAHQVAQAIPIPKKRGPVKGTSTLVDIPLSRLNEIFAPTATVKVSRKWLNLIAGDVSVNSSAAQEVENSEPANVGPALEVIDPTQDF